MSDGVRHECLAWTVRAKLTQRIVARLKLGLLPLQEAAELERVWLSVTLAVAVAAAYAQTIQDDPPAMYDYEQVLPALQGQDRLPELELEDCSLLQCIPEEDAVLLSISRQQEEQA